MIGMVRKLVRRLSGCSVGYTYCWRLGRHWRINHETVRGQVLLSLESWLGYWQEVPWRVKHALADRFSDWAMKLRGSPRFDVGWDIQGNLPADLHDSISTRLILMPDEAWDEPEQKWETLKRLNVLAHLAGELYVRPKG